VTQEWSICAPGGLGVSWASRSGGRRTPATRSRSRRRGRSRRPVPPPGSQASGHPDRAGHRAVNAGFPGWPRERGVVRNEPDQAPGADGPPQAGHGRGRRTPRRRPHATVQPGQAPVSRHAPNHQTARTCPNNRAPDCLIPRTAVSADGPARHPSQFGDLHGSGPLGAHSGRHDT